jgi:hypothetical protein
MLTTFTAAKTALAPYVDNGLDPDNARVTQRINEAQRRLIDHYNFLSRREELEKTPLVFVEGGTAGMLILDDLDATKVMILALWREENNELEFATALEQKALAYIERNLTEEVQRTRRVVTGEVGRLHNELPDGLKFPTARLTTLLSQAGTEAAAHLEFFQRREELDGPSLTVSFEVKKKLVESYIATAQAAVEPAMALKKEALDLLERDIIAAVEKSRKAVTGEVGRLHNELPDGLKFPTARLTTLLSQAGTEAAAHLEFLQRREELDGPSLTVSFEVKKKLVESYIATAQAAVEPAMALKKEALDLIERDIIAVVGKSRKAVIGEVGRLHNELPTGLKVPTSRMTKLLNQAVSDAISHQKFVARSDDDDIPTPPATYEQKRLLVESYLAALEGQSELSLGLKKSALDLIERDVVANDETFRRTLRMELSLGSPNSFGYYWGRIGLGFDGALTFSNNAIKRAVTSAEEALMNSGKWVGTVADYSFTLEQSGEVFLPREVETVLFVTFDGDPRPVHDRFAEYMRGGTGIKTTEEPWRSGFSDRGEAVDPDDGITKRRYFVSVPQENKETLVRYLAKRRFVPHLADTDSMYLNNYEAVSQAALAILTQGKAGSFDAGKKLLADQMTQQYFKSQVFGVHNRSILAMR